jgi:hypothetical protein
MIAVPVGPLAAIISVLRGEVLPIMTDLAARCQDLFMVELAVPPSAEGSGGGCRPGCWPEAGGR